MSLDLDTLDSLSNGQLLIIINTPHGFNSICRARAAIILEQRKHANGIDSRTNDDDSTSYSDCTNGNFGDS